MTLKKLGRELSLRDFFVCRIRLASYRVEARAMDTESRQHLKELLETHRARLRLLEQKAAIYGLNVPPEVSIEVAKLHTEVARIKAALYITLTPTDRAKLDALRQEARRAYFVKSWKKAIDLLSQLASQDLDDEDIRLKLVEARRQLRLQEDYQALCTLKEEGLWEAVLVGLDELERHSPGYSDTMNLRSWATRQNRQKQRDHRYEAALKAYQKEDWLSAINKLSVLLSESPNDTKAQDLLGRARRMRQASQDIELPVDLSLEEAFAGCEYDIQIAPTRRLTVRIPPGVDTGTRVRVQGEGKPATKDAGAGDLYLLVKIRAHSQFEREGNDLTIAVSVEPRKLIQGGEVQVKDILGRIITLNLSSGMPSGKLYRLTGQGMPILRNPTERGDLYIRIEEKKRFIVKH